jgi:adenylate cyclase class 2
MEIEAKIRLEEPFKLRASLRSAGAVFEGRVLERNWLYDHPDKKLARADKLVRLREDTRTRLTFKGPRKKSEYKEREEIELFFPDIESARSFSESIGFVKWFYYEKLRETWKFDNCEVVIDELPELGIFVEIEGPTTAEIEDAVRKLKLQRTYISTSYVEMLQENAPGNDGNPHEFKFSPHHEFILANNEGQ